MREHKKKPGDMARARAKHLRRQEIQDAITATRRLGPGDAPVRLRLHKHHSLGWCEWDLTPFPPACRACDETRTTGQPAPVPAASWAHVAGACMCWDWPCPAVYLVRLSGSCLEVALVTDKDGFKACTSTGTFYIHSGRELLARATPVNDAAKAWA